MLNDRTMLAGTCAAVMLSVLVAGAVTYLTAARAAPDAIVFETPTSHLKGDRLDKPATPPVRRSDDCSKYGSPYEGDACLPRPRDLRIASADRRPAR